jgi:hypothetical protein
MPNATGFILDENLSGFPMYRKSSRWETLQVFQTSENPAIDIKSQSLSTPTQPLNPENPLIL